MHRNGFGRRELFGLSLLAITAREEFSKFELPMQPPKFKLGDRVRYEWLLDDDLALNHRRLQWVEGIVFGFVWSWPDWVDQERSQGWSYWVKFDLKNGTPLRFQNCDFLHEIDLILKR